MNPFASQLTAPAPVRLSAAPLTLVSSPSWPGTRREAAGSHLSCATRPMEAFTPPIGAVHADAASTGYDPTENRAPVARDVVAAVAMAVALAATVKALRGTSSRTSALLRPGPLWLLTVMLLAVEWGIVLGTTGTT